MTGIVYFRSYSKVEAVAAWPEAGRLLTDVLQKTGYDQLYSLDDLLWLIQDDRMQLWGIEQGGRMITAITTEIVNYPRRKALRIFLVSGDGLGAWPHWWDNLEEWARSIGCQRMECGGRLGWTRKLAPVGVRTEGVMYAKDLTDG